MAVRLLRLAMISADPDKLAGFFEAAFGFERIGERRPDPTWRAEGEASQGSAAPEDEGWIASSAARDGGGEAAHTVGIRLGDQIVHLIAPRPIGAPYPGDVPGWSPLFQHFAIIVSDMEAAYARLSTCGGWTAISRDGPQTLPKSSGGVTAFKFRDPEGHPLELLAFPPGAAPQPWRHATAGALCLGIDHSAISVADTARSVRFYESLGLRVAQTSHNRGEEQARLDDIDAADVEVTGLTCPAQPAPHVELLFYRGAFARSGPTPGESDVCATRFVFALAEASRIALRSHYPDAFLDDGLIRDPDGHLIQLVTA